jgi:GDP-D-mannose dehydratase
MSNQPKTFLLTGATGVVGTYLTHLLLEAVVGDVADLEAAHADWLSRPPYLKG